MDVPRVIPPFLLPPMGTVPQVGIAPHFRLNALRTVLGCMAGTARAARIVVQR